MITYNGVDTFFDVPVTELNSDGKRITKPDTQRATAMMNFWKKFPNDEEAQHFVLVMKAVLKNLGVGK